jgi:hypothetical protein
VTKNIEDLYLRTEYLFFSGCLCLHLVGFSSVLSYTGLHLEERMENRSLKATVRRLIIQLTDPMACYLIRLRSAAT